MTAPRGIHLSWDHLLILEWTEGDTGVWTDGPAFEDVLQAELFGRIMAWREGMDAAYAEHHLDDAPPVDPAVAVALMEELTAIRRELHDQGYRVTSSGDSWPFC